MPGIYASFRQIATNSNASYHSLETSLSRRFNRGLTFLASYTFGKLLDYYSAQNLGQTPQNPFNERLDRARSDEDRNQVFSGSFVYDIPFLRERKGLDVESVRRLVCFRIGYQGDRPAGLCDQRAG